MITLILSEDANGEQRIEKMLEWKNYAEPEDRHEEIDQTLNRVYQLHQGTRQVYAVSAPNLLTYLTENPLSKGRPSQAQPGSGC
ncbi:hypothetical protein JST97_06010 [bacterium]|nr:hypothetical protein [bacterium]